MEATIAVDNDPKQKAVAILGAPTSFVLYLKRETEINIVHSAGALTIVKM